MRYKPSDPSDSPTPPNCHSCGARKVSVFCDLPVNELELLSTTKNCRMYARGETIYRVDEYPSGLFCIHEGKVKVSRINPAGRERIVNFRNRGDVLGYRELIGGGPYQSYATPIEDSRICIIPKEFFRTQLMVNVDILTQLYRLLAIDAEAVEASLVELPSRSAMERTAETLLMLGTIYGFENDGVTLNIRLTREELASAVGITREATIRTLADIKRKHVVDLPGRRIRIMNRHALLQLANVRGC